MSRIDACPECCTEVERAGAAPEWGDLAVCTSCAAPLVYTAHGYRKVTHARFAALPEKTRGRLLDAGARFYP